MRFRRSVLYLGSLFLCLLTFVMSGRQAFAAWNLSDAVYDNVSFSIAAQYSGGSQDVFFKSDGTKMYVPNYYSSLIYQYSLSTAWDLSSASYDNVSFSTNAQLPQPRGIAFNSNGTKFYVVGESKQAVFQYSMSTPWDISTASYNNATYSVSAQSSYPVDLEFSPDGTKMYISDFSNHKVIEYALGTAWDLSTTSFTNKTFLYSGQDQYSEDTSFSADGSTMFMNGANSSKIYQYSLSTPWDVTTATYASKNISYSGQGSVQGMYFKPDGTKFYLDSTNNSAIYQYSLGAAATPTPTPTPTAVPTPTPTPTSTPTPTPTPTPVPSSNTSSSTTSTTSAPSCSDSAPAGVPDLFQIDANQNSATLHFTTVSGAIGYQISYGLDSGASSYGDKFDYSGPLWTLDHTINNLTFNTTYYFKVQAVNGCNGGKFSKTVSATTKSNVLLNEIINPPVTEKNTNSGTQQAAKTISQVPVVNNIVDKKIEVKKTEITPKPNAGKQLPQESGYNLDIKVLTDSGVPLAGVKVTLHSTPRESVTNKDGIAHFSNIEGGKHQVFLAYNGYNGGGQAINVTGDNKNVELTMQIQMTDGFSSPKVMAVITALGLAIAILLFLLIKSKKRHHKEAESSDTRTWIKFLKEAKLLLFSKMLVEEGDSTVDSSGPAGRH